VLSSPISHLVVEAFHLFQESLIVLFKLSYRLGKLNNLVLQLIRDLFEIPGLLADFSVLSSSHLATPNTLYIDAPLAVCPPSL